MNQMLPELVRCEDGARGMKARVELLTGTVTFKAWVVPLEGEGNPRLEARPVELPDYIDTPEEAAAFCCNCLLHKASIMVLRTDAGQRAERRNLLSTFVVKKRSRAEWVRDAAGKSVRAAPEYPDFVMQVFVREGFNPVEPWKVEDGNLAGHDYTLVEQRG